MLSRDYVEFPPSHLSLPANAQRVGDVSPDEWIELSVHLKPRRDPRSTDEALPGTDRRAALRAQRAALHRDDFRLLQEFATQHDLMITDIIPEQRLVKIRGRASKMQAAFR